MESGVCICVQGQGHSGINCLLSLRCGFGIDPQLDLEGFSEEEGEIDRYGSHCTTMLMEGRTERSRKEVVLFFLKAFTLFFFTLKTNCVNGVVWWV